MDELEVNKFYASNKSIHRFISTYFNIPASNLQFRDLDFMKIFGCLENLDLKKDVLTFLA